MMAKRTVDGFSQTYQLRKSFLRLGVDLDELEQPREQLRRTVISFLHRKESLPDY